MRGVTTFLCVQDAELNGFQSTLPMRGVTLTEFSLSAGMTISIHTPHAGSDTFHAMRGIIISRISIHTPHAGSDGVPILNRHLVEISIHTPHAGSDQVAFRIPESPQISIHTPHAGSDMG